MAQQQSRALRSASKTSPRASRQAKSSISYREPSTESENEVDYEEDYEPDEILAVRKQPKRRIPTPRATPNKRPRQNSPSPPYPKNSPSGRDRRQPNTYRHKELNFSKAKPSKSEPPNVNTSSGAIPPWSSLPYQILLQIFQYASYPLYDERTFQAQPSVNWLVKTSLLCRSFTEPALTALYRSPPLVPMDHAHRLRLLLMAEPDAMSLNYRSKVERLQMEVSQTAAYTLPGYGLLDLHGLIYNCPRLLDLELYHQKDMSPYRRLDETIKWSYPETLFEALNNNVNGSATYLRSWRWSSRMAGKKWPIESFLSVHKSLSFSGLRKIAFVNYQKPPARKNVADPKHENLLADSLSVLPLQHLIFESSTLVNKILLPLLPTSLRHLELINCWEVTSDDFAPFLLTHGNNLRSLILNHNQSLNVSFLTVLENACPNLEILKMNLTYYNVHSTYRNSEPWYEKLLGTDEIPCWPKSLQSIELTQLRNWDIETAKMFFQSILSSAHSLINLRRLIIKATINTSWRDRSTFRDKWVGAFTRVFKRRWKPPNPHLRSFRTYSTSKRLCHDATRPAAGHSEIRHPAHSLAEQGPDTNRDFDLDSLKSNNLELANGTGAASAPKTSNLIANRQAHGDLEDEKTGQAQNEPDVSRRTRHSSRIASIKSSHELDSVVKSNDDDQSDMNRPSQRELRRKGVIDRELEVLHSTAGTHSPRHGNGSNSRDSGSDSDDKPLARRVYRNADIVQGLCDIVSITIDNLRPTETQFVEADFLDSEPEGDEDWDGTEDVGDTRYAW